MNSWMGFSRTAVAMAAVAVVAAAPALAQNTTSSITGRITGADGQPVAGATVSIVHVESRTTTTVTTDAQGRYTARGLRAGGPFTVTVTRGTQTEKRDDVFLALAETASLDLTLGATQTITVTGRSGSERFNASNMGAGTGINNRELNAYASVQRNLQDYARIDPRIAQTDKQNGEISALGQNTRFNSITIDGVTTNDTFGLEANNLPTKKQPISIDALQSVQINLSNYDVTQKGYTGANVNAVTKSGTNEVHGSLYYVWRNADYAGQRVVSRTAGTYAPPAPFKDYTMGFVVGGPIIKDKLFFFGSYEEYNSSKTSPTNGPLGSSLTNVAITQSAIDSATSIAQTKWGLNPGTSALPAGLALKVKDTLFKLDWNISDDHRANIRYSKTEQTDPTLNGFSQTGLSLSSYWFSQEKTLETLVGQWFADWTPNFSTELKASKRDYDSAPTPLLGRQPTVFLRFSGTPPAAEQVPGVVYNNRTLSFGTEESRHLNVLKTKTDDFYAGANLTLGDHELKFGADYARNEIYNAFLQNIYGTYTFACEPGTYSTFSIPTAGGGCNASTVTQAQRDQAVLENFQRGLPSAYTVQVPLQGRTISDGIATWRYENTGLFLQDTWRVSSSLNFMFGARVDMMKVPIKPLFNAAAAAPTVAGRVTDPTGVAGANAVVRNTGGFGYDNSVTLDNTELVQPRFGFNWKLPTTQRMQLRGGIGLFQGAAANVWLSNPFSNPGVAVTSFNCNTFAACNGNQSSSSATLASVFSPNPDAPGTPVGAAPGANVDFISPQLRQPSLWKMNLAFDAELPELPVVGRLVAGAEWVHSDVKSGIYYKNLNLGAATRSDGPDGRPMFWMPQSYNPNCWSGSSLGTANVVVGGVTQFCAGGRDRALSSAGFGRNVLLAEKTGKGGGDTITLSLNMPAGPSGVSWTVAYTRTTAKEMSPLTSSTSNSNWNLRSIFNPNEEVLQNSNYLIRDRVSGALNWTAALLDSKYRTTVGLFYEGRRGKPYSWTYINDMNGDGFSNDLMYIPKGPGSGEVVFKGGAAEEAQFWSIVDSYKALSGAKGGVVGRNNTFAPWVNNFDLRIKQELPGFTAQHKASVTLDILNVGNLLSKRWGRIDEMPFPSRRSFVNYNGLDTSGRYVYSLGSLTDYTTRQAVGESQWAAQVTLRYEF